MSDAGKALELIEGIKKEMIKKRAQERLTQIDEQEKNNGVTIETKVRRIVQERRLMF